VIEERVGLSSAQIAADAGTRSSSITRAIISSGMPSRRSSTTSLARSIWSSQYQR